MYGLKYYAIGLLLFSVIEAKADRIRTALKLLEKKEFEKVKENLEKEFEKDSLSAGASFVYALYFIDVDNPSYHIDSAYFFINQALQFYPLTEEKQLQELQKISINDSSLNAEKLYIEKIAFQTAQEQNSVEALQHFIDNYPTAWQIKDATSKRDELAWQDALEQNTESSYLYFMQTYPNARQIAQAKSKYDRLFIDRQTQDRTLETFERFVQNFPENTFVKEAERAIFEMTTTSHNIKNYHNFLLKYPNNTYTQKTYDWLLAFYYEFFNITIFANQYPDFYDKKLLESLLAVEKQQYVPILQDEAYHYIDQNGNPSPIDYLTAIPESHRCQSISENFFIIETEQGKGLMDKTGRVLIAPRYEAVEYFDIGLYEVQKEGKKGLYHIQGYTILSPDFQALDLLNAYFLKFQQDNLWGLSTYNGTTFLANEYDEITALGENFVLFKKGNQVGVVSNTFLQENLWQPKISITLSYDSIALLSNDYAIAFREGQQTILDKTGKNILPFTTQSWQYMGVGWALGTDSTGFQLFTEKGVPIVKDTFDIVMGNNHYLVAQKNGFFGFFDAEAELVKPFLYEDVFFMGDITFYRQKDTLWAEFEAGNPINFSTFEEFTIQISDEESLSWVLLAKDKQGKIQVFTPAGKPLFAEKYAEIFWLESQFFSFKQNNRYGLLNVKGEILLKPQYEGISKTDEQHFGLLYRGKFGLFRKKDALLISPNYDILPQPYTKNDENSLFIVQMKGKMGIIDSQEKVVIPYEFQTIKTWQDSTALVLEDDSWRFYNFGKQVKSNDKKQFQEVEFVKATDEETIIIVLEDEVHYGAWSSLYGELLPTEYEFITNIGTVESPILVGEKKSKRKNHYEIIYINHKGKILWQATLSEDDYAKIICE